MDECVCQCTVGHALLGCSKNLLQCGRHYYHFRSETSYKCHFVIAVVVAVAFAITSFDDNVIVVSAMPIAVTA